MLIPDHRNECNTHTDERVCAHTHTHAHHTHTPHLRERVAAADPAPVVHSDVARLCLVHLAHLRLAPARQGVWRCGVLLDELVPGPCTVRGQASR